MIRKYVLGAAAMYTAAIIALLLVFAPVTARESTANPALWKIDGPNGDIYLFGSIHILPKGTVWRRPELDAALQQAQRLVFELDLDEAKNPAASIALVSKYGFLPPDKSLFKMIAPEYRAQLVEAAKTFGVPEAAMDRMRPWLAAITLTSLNIVKQTTKKGDPLNPNAAMEELAGVDVQLWEWSKTANKQRGALETSEEQIRVFADLSHDQQVQLLVTTLKEISEPPEMLNQLIGAWKKGDSNASAFPALQKALFYDRHVKWLPQIEKMMADGQTHVIVVGAGHLVGKDSVVAMLRAKGIKVEGP
jgi:uncharacterized protein